METVLLFIIFAAIGAFIWFFIIAKVSQNNLKKAAGDRIAKIKEALYSKNGNFTAVIGTLKEDPPGLTPIKEASIALVQQLHSIDSVLIGNLRKESAENGKDNVQSLIKMALG